MSRILRKLEQLVTALAIGLALALLSVELAERTGLSTQIARGVMARWLPEGRWDLAHCRVDLSGPTLELVDVRWSRDGAELARVERISVTLAPFGWDRPRLESARVEGGRVRTGARLVAALQPSAGDEDGGARPRALARRVRVELDDIEFLDDAGLRSLGHFGAVLDVEDTNELRLSGTLRDGTGARGVVRGRGRLYDDGEILIDLETSALPLAPIGAFFPELGLETRGTARVVARARGRSDRLESVVADLSIQRFGTTSDQAVRRLDGVDIDGRVQWRPSGSPIGTLDGRMTGRGTWAGGALVFGWRGGASPFGEVFVHTADRVIDDAIREVVRLAVPGEEDVVDETFQALGVEGRANVWFGLRLVEADPGPRGVVGLTSDLALVGRVNGGATAQIDGWADDEGRLQGFPMRVDGLIGTTVYGHRGDSAMRDRMATLPTVGRVGDGRMRVEGWLASPLPSYARAQRSTDSRARLRFRVVVDDLPIDGDLVHAIEATGAGVDIEDLIAPRAGRVSGRVELEQSPAFEGFVLSVDARLNGVQGRWSDPPLHFVGADGAFALRVGGRTGDMGADDGERRRALGFQVVASGSPVGEPTARVSVAGVSRSPDALAIATQGDDQLFQWKIGLSGLRSDSPSLAGFIDAEVGGEIERLELRGLVAATYHTTSPLFRRDAQDRLSVAASAISARQGELRFESGSVRASLERERTIDDEREGAVEPWRGDFDVRARDSAGAEWSVAGGVLPDRATTIMVHAAGLRPGNAAYSSFVAGNAPLRGALDGWAELDLWVGWQPRDELLQLRRATVHLRGAGVALDGLNIEALEGALTANQTRIESNVVKGELAGSPFELRDVEYHLDPARSAITPTMSLPNDSDGQPVPVLFEARVFAQNLPLEPRELAQSDAALVRWASDHRWRGRVDLNGLNVAVGLDSRGEPVVRAHGALVPHDLFAYLSFPLRLSSGSLDVEDLVADSRGLAARARLTDAYGEVASRPFARLGASLELTHDDLLVRDLVGQVSGGTVTGFGRRDDPRTAVHVVLGDEPTFRIGLSAQRVDIGEVLADLFGSRVQSRGLLGGQIELEGTGDDLLTYSARGRARIGDARLWSLPVIRELFATLGLDATATFDWIESDFELADGRLFLRETVAHSPILKLVGGGFVDVDGTLDQEFDLHYSVVDRVPFLSKVFYWFQSRLVRIEVGGTIERPRVRLANALRDLFRRGDDAELLLPLPPMTPLPLRF